MHGGDYAWILPGDTDPLEMISDRHADIEECSSSQLTQTLDGLIIVKSHDSVVGNVMSDTGLVRSLSFFFSKFTISEVNLLQSATGKRIKD